MTADDQTDPKPEDASPAPGSAQNPDDPKPEGGAHSPDAAQGVAADGDAGRG